MTIVRITEDRYVEAIGLSEYAFQYKVPEEDQSKRFETLNKHQIFGVIDNDQLKAKLHLLTLETFLGNRKMKMGGIAGVATFPEYRRKGYVKELLKDCLVKMKDQGMTVSMLHPFDVSFYRKFGYELFNNRLTSKLKQSDLVMFKDVVGNVRRYTLKTLHLEELKQVYEQYAETFSGMLVRDEKWWEDVIEDQNVGVYYNSSNQPAGYMLYEVKDDKMKVEEFVAVTSEARKGLWNFICQHDSMITNLELITHEREPLLFALQKQKTVKREVSPYFMVRIVDAEVFLKEYEFATNEEIKLQIIDTYAPWNEKTFSVSNQSVSAVEESNDSIKLSINALSTILFGHQRPTELFQAGLISGDEEKVNLFEKMVPTRQAHFYDFF